MLPEQVDRSAEIPEVSTPTSNVLPKENAATMVSLSTLIVSMAEPSSRLEEPGVAKAPLIEDGARVARPISPQRLLLSLQC